MNESLTSNDSFETCDSLDSNDSKENLLNRAELGEIENEGDESEGDYEEPADSGNETGVPKSLLNSGILRNLSLIKAMQRRRSLYSQTSDGKYNIGSYVTTVKSSPEDYRYNLLVSRDDVEEDEETECTCSIL